jgi:hypothetical protein
MTPSDGVLHSVALQILAGAVRRVVRQNETCAVWPGLAAGGGFGITTVDDCWSRGGRQEKATRRRQINGANSASWRRRPVQLDRWLYAAPIGTRSTWPGWMTSGSSS